MMILSTKKEVLKYVIIFICIYTHIYIYKYIFTEYNIILNNIETYQC